jgi:glycosyltransferase involved in cell wall biosynthesis
LLQFKINIVRSMSNYDLSILIPARNEMFLGRTIQDILENIEGKTEIIAVLDGYKPDPALPPDPRVTLIYNPEAKGQRAATNQAAKLSKAKYLMKCDAHCAFDKGFDTKMINDMYDNWTMVPLMKNLHAFDWICPDGHRRYQGPSGPCLECGKETTRDVVWIAKRSPNSRSYCFDSTPHFQYFGEYSKRPEGQGEITETMSLQGSCWMLTREKYWDLNVCDENFGSWGSQGIEVAVKTWLSGGRVACNQKTWYAHMFRTQGGDFGFPYPISGRDQEKAKNFARDLFFNNNWPKQVLPLSWLVEKFWPVKGWTDEDLAKLKTNTFKFSEKSPPTKPIESEPVETISIAEQSQTDVNKLIEGTIFVSGDNLKSGEISIYHKPIGPPPSKGIIYYTDSRLDEKVATPVRDRLSQISFEKNIPILSASIRKLNFGGRNIHFPHLKPSYLTMFKQIMSAIEHSESEIIYFCEHDVLYHPSHFDFTPPDVHTFYYNRNVWFLRTTDGHALHFDVNQLSGLCVYRKAALAHFKERYEMALKASGELGEKEFNKFIRNMGFEPMTHGRVKWINSFKLGGWKSEFPNIDIKHGENATGVRWEKTRYRNQKLLINWMETDSEIPGWGKTADLIKQF